MHTSEWRELISLPRAPADFSLECERREGGPPVIVTPRRFSAHRPDPPLSQPALRSQRSQRPLLCRRLVRRRSLPRLLQAGLACLFRRAPISPRRRNINRKVKPSAVDAGTLEKLSGELRQEKPPKPRWPSFLKNNAAFR